MGELGYVEGRNLVVTQAFAAGKREDLPALVTDLVKKKVDVLVTTSTAETQAAKRATTRIPIVMTVAFRSGWCAGAASGGSAGRGAATGAVLGGVVGGVAGGAIRVLEVQGGIRPRICLMHERARILHGPRRGDGSAAAPGAGGRRAAAAAAGRRRPPAAARHRDSHACRRGRTPTRSHPAGSLSAPGYCRLWYPGRPPGQQPNPFPASKPVAVPAGAFILYKGVAWDSDYDWRAHSRRQPGSVPSVIVEMSVKR